MKTVYIKDYLTQFRAANTYLWTIYEPHMVWDAMSNDWLNEWNIRVVNNIWPDKHCLIFPSEAAFTFWLLKWSGDDRAQLLDKLPPP